jgi:ligand-binding sensor domain-containing protein
MRLLLLFIVCYFLAQEISAQQFNFLPVKSSNELPSSQTNGIFQDSHDYIWICTDAGLAKFNGREYKSFTVAEGLTDNTIFRVSEDDRGRLWYSSSNSKLGYIKNDSAFVPPISDTLWKVLLKGRYFIYSVSNYDNDQLIISTQAGFYLTDAATMSQFKPVERFRDSTVLWVKVRNKKSWSAHYTPKEFVKFIFRMDIEMDKKTITIPVRIKMGFSAMSIFTHLLLSDGRLLVGVTDRIYIIQPNGSYDTLTNPSRLTSFYQDRNGGIWISYLGNGVHYYPKGKILGEKYIHVLKGSSITGFVMDKEEGMWLSTEGVLYCPSLHVVTYPDEPMLKLRLAGLAVMGNKVIANSLTEEYYLFYDKNQFEKKIFANPDIKGNYSYLDLGDKIYAAGLRGTFLLDSNLNYKKTLLVKRYNMGTMMYRITAGPDKRIWGVRLNDLLEVKNDTIYEVLKLPSRGRNVTVDRDNNVFVGTNSGLYLYEADSLRLIKDISVKIARLRTDPEGRVWVCSDGQGLFVMEGKRISIEYSVKNGLPSGICYDIDFDSEGNRWVATNGGLCRISRDGKTLSVFKTQHGLPSNEVFKVLVNRNELYVVTQKGLCVIDLLNFELKNVKPGIFIKRVYNDSLFLTDGCQLNYSQNNVSFSVEGIAYQNPFGVRYKYRLTGLDTTWRYDQTGEIRFNNLNDGKYVFEVVAVNADGIESSKPEIFTFSITSPYWERWWFFVMCGAALVSFMTVIILVRSKAIRKREEAKTLLHKQIAEYQMTAIQAQMNPHFIFNAINSIQNYVLSHETQYAYDYLAKFSKLIRQVLQNSQKSLLSLRKEIDMLDLYIELEQRRFQNKFTYEIICTDELSVDEVKVPVMFIQPYIENAIWHGIMNLEENKTGELKIIFSTEAGFLKIVIHDNGIGRVRAGLLKKRKDHQSMGMLLTERRLEILKTISDQEIRTVITDLYDTSGAASGTQVEIYLPLKE